MLRVDSSKNVSEQCDINLKDEQTCQSEEIARFEQVYTNLEMNGPSLPASFYTDL